MEKIKILYVTFNLGLGGQEKRLFELIKNIDKDIIDFILLSLSGNSEREIYFNAYGLPFHFCNGCNKFKKLKMIFQKCREFKPDIVHSFDIISNVYVGTLKKLLRLKIIGGFNASIIESKIIRYGNRIFSNSFEKIVCNSYAGYNYLKDFCKISKEKLMVIHNGLDFEVMENPPFKVSSLKEILKREIKGPVIGLVGKLDKNKDPLTFVKAANIVHKRFPEVLFCIIGDGIYRDMLQDYLIKNEMLDYFYLIPKRIDAPWIIKDFDICVLSSKNEGFPNVILEYMYWEKPCVVTNAGDSEKIVVNGKTGFLVNKGDYDNFAKSLITLLENPDLMIKMGKEGKKILIENYGIKKYVESFLSLYFSVLKKNNIYHQVL